MFRYFVNSFIDLFKANIGVKRLLGKVLHYFLDAFPKYISKVMKVKADDNCELPAAVENPSKYKSIEVALTVASANMVRKHRS